jgi:hypothetical protein
VINLQTNFDASISITEIQHYVLNDSMVLHF